VASAARHRTNPRPIAKRAAPTFLFRLVVRLRWLGEEHRDR
jgi:hypothetical protein